MSPSGRCIACFSLFLSPLVYLGFRGGVRSPRRPRSPVTRAPNPRDMRSLWSLPPSG